MLLVLAYPLRFEAMLVRMTQLPSRDAFLNVVQYSPLVSPHWRSQLTRTVHSIADVPSNFVPTMNTWSKQRILALGHDQTATATVMSRTWPIARCFPRSRS